MSYEYFGTQDLIALPGRSVQTFPSGLVRVDRSYMCRPQFAERYRSQLAVGNSMPLDDGKPAIDGLFIFPEPQENRRQNGFLQFDVSAYGRTNTQGSHTENFLQDTIQGLSFAYTQVTVERCVFNETALSEILNPPEVELGFVIDTPDDDDPRSSDVVRVISIPLGPMEARPVRDIFGGFIIGGGERFRFSHGGLIIERKTDYFFIQWLYMFNGRQPKVIANSSRNYGSFSEFTITYGFTGSGLPISLTAFQGEWRITATS